VDVIDGATDSVVATVRLDDYASAVCLADSGRRAFGAVYSDDAVGVIDCSTDSLITTVGTEARLSALCLAPTGNKVYCANSSGNTVTVIDGSNNSISTVIGVGFHPVALLHNPTVNKVYSANSGDYYSPATLTVIDAQGDSVLHTLETGVPGHAGDQDLCLNTVNSRVYLSSKEEDRVAVIDAVSDTIVAQVPVDYPTVLCYSPDYNYIYAATGLSSVDVIDCGPNTLIATVEVSSDPAALCYVPVGAKVYTANQSEGSVSVIAGERPSVVAEIDIGSPVALCWDSKDNKVFCADLVDGKVGVIDASADTIVATLPVGDNPVALSYDLLNDYVYCVCRASNAVYVIDAHRDSLVGQVAVGAEPFALAWNPIELRTYVLNYGSSSVSVLHDSLHVGLAEEGVGVLAERRVTPTVVRGVLPLVSSSNLKPQATSLLDISGRRVLDLHPGANDVSRLAPGVYFIREAQAQAIRKVVITK
jgi:YVTN family beta-propeller protein